MGRIRKARFSTPAPVARQLADRGPVNLVTIRAAIIAALKDAGYLHIPEGRRDHTTRLKYSAFTASIGHRGTFTEHAGTLYPG